jgi:hypothetical protein
MATDDNPVRALLLMGLDLATEETLRQVAENDKATRAPAPRNPCCGNTGSHREGKSEYCSTCGAELARRPA